MSEELDLAACVRRGAALLDRTHPGWAERIDRDRLDMNDCLDCIIGQMFGSYFCIIGSAQEYFPGTFNVGLAPEVWGFTADYGEDCDALTPLWRAEIRRRMHGTDHRGV